MLNSWRCTVLSGPLGLLCWLGASGPALAREIVVSPGPAGAGVLAQALETAADGDTIRVQKGLYAETVVIRKRVAVIGEAGACIRPRSPSARGPCS
jgi:hypothetical protein